MTLPPAVDGVPAFNQPINPTGGQNIPCFSAVGPDNCVDPGAYQCRGSGCTGNGGATMDLIVQEMQRVEPSIREAEVTLTYIYRSLGNAGGPYTPEIVVNIGQRSYDLAILALGDGKSPDGEGGFNRNFVANTVAHEATIYSGVAASAFGESLFDSTTGTASGTVAPPASTSGT